jgi:arabinose-5-phosphate isomerase
MLYTKIIYKSLIQQADSLKTLAKSIDEVAYDEVLKILLTCKGKVIISGVGKSGHIGRKIAATLASTGTSSFFVHSTEALHGDLGMIEKNDVVIFISNSGETNEVIGVIPSLQKRGNKLLAITSNAQSTLANTCEATLLVNYDEESCPNNLAPTTSTTLTLAIGDALAAALIIAKKFKAPDFAIHHPSGSLGKRLLTKVSDVMERNNLPIVSESASIKETLLAIAGNKFGMAIIINDNERFVGLATDGDIRRALLKGDWNVIGSKSVSSIMNITPITITEDIMLADAEVLMKNNHAKVLPVITNTDKCVGIVEIFD